MPHRYDIYSSLSDQELIEKLTATPVDEKLHSYFFTKKCRQFLRYISSNIYQCESENVNMSKFSLKHLGEAYGNNGNGNTDYEDKTAHCRCALLCKVPCRTDFLNHLSCLDLAKIRHYKNSCYCRNRKSYGKSQNKTNYHL